MLILKYLLYVTCFFVTNISWCSFTKKDSPRILIKDLNQLRQTIEDHKKEKSKSSRTSSTTTTPHQLLSPQDKNNQTSSEENN